MEILSKRVKWLREKNDLGQKELAAGIGITLSATQKLEYNEREPKLDKLIKISKFFNVSTDFLLGLSDETPKLKKIKEALNDYKRRLKQQTERKQLIQQRLYSIKMDNSSDNVREGRVLEPQLNDLASQLNQLHMRIHSFTEEYLNEIVSIPYFKLSNDEIFLDLKPTGIFIEGDADGFWVKIEIDSNREIPLGVFNDLEKAEKYEMYYLDQLQDVVINNKLVQINREMEETIHNLRENPDLFKNIDIETK